MEDVISEYICDMEDSHLFSVCAHLDGIRNETCCFLFRHGADVFQTHRKLNTHTEHTVNKTQLGVKDLLSREVFYVVPIFQVNVLRD